MKVFDVGAGTLSLSLFIDVTNSKELLDSMQTGTLEPEVAFLNASLIKAIGEIVKGKEIDLEELVGRANQAQIQKHYKISCLELGIGSLADAITCRIAAPASRMLCTISKLRVLQGYIKETVLLPARSRDAEGSDLHRGSHHKRSFRRITDCKLLMHETTVHNRLVLQHNLIAVAALQSLLISVAFMRTVLHLLKIPYHTEFSH
ncbi:hypothetical protein Cgig2_019394 [Carnegiea gigantea]|uniref:Uncharacterized protein n=1 Tax=Carnegiea gigantea TaxID=171969 RepID=A0A9Q1KQS7_9CARY|nr:hypothetical protein Cgig2_019394 [Carnegiea gigantea]